MLFSVDLKDACLHIPIVKDHKHFLYFEEGLPFILVMAHRVITSLSKPILFFCQCKGVLFLIIVYLDDILVDIYSEDIGKRA